MENIMVDEDRGFSCLLDTFNEIKRLFGFGERQTHSWFIKDHELCIEIKGACNRYALLLATRHGGDDVIWMDGGRRKAHMLAHQSRSF